MSSPIVQNIPGSERLHGLRTAACVVFGGVFMKYPG